MASFNFYELDIKKLRVSDYYYEGKCGGAIGGGGGCHSKEGIKLCLHRDRTFLVFRCKQHYTDYILSDQDLFLLRIEGVL